MNEKYEVIRDFGRLKKGEVIKENEGYVHKGIVESCSDCIGEYDIYCLRELMRDNVIKEKE